MKMNNIILPLIALLLCGVSCCIMRRDVQEHPLLATEYDGETDKPIGSNKGLILYSIVMVLITVAVSVVETIVYDDIGIWARIKAIALLAIIWPIAYIDLKTYRIPNSFIIFGLITRALIFPFELINVSQPWLVLLFDVIAAAALLIAAFLSSLCIKNAIGYGDMKLFVVMGLMLGMEGVWTAVFLSLIVSFIAAVYLLVTKKKSKNDLIPFGPALVIGTFISVCLTGL